MKKFPLYLMFAALSAGALTACGDDDTDTDGLTAKDLALQSSVTQFVNKTVIPTYKQLADGTITLHSALVALKSQKTDVNLTAATAAWINTRAHWELSEAFLFGAVADLGIDPHIDTWPLDENSFNNMMGNSGFLASMDGEGGDVWAGEHLGDALLGFHGIEFIIFKDGAKKPLNEITAEQLIYAVAVSGDLRNQCIHLEGAWAGYDALSIEKKAIVDELELPLTVSNGEFTYGENMLNAGLAGSTYRSVTAAAAAILDGCMVISEEVGELKIGNAHRGDDVTYIESPYSHNSKTDFVNNIKSIENAYLGGAYDSRGASVSAYVANVDAQADQRVKAAATAAIAAINAIPSPFKNNFSSPLAGAAMDACDELTKALQATKQIINQQ
jgi:hypothetical protein